MLRLWADVALIWLMARCVTIELWASERLSYRALEMVERERRIRGGR